MTPAYKILKYPLEQLNLQHLHLHFGYRIIHADVQHGKPCIWVLSDTNAETIQVSFEMVDTGQLIRNINDKMFIGTFLLEEGTTVIHLFRIIF